MCRKLSHYTKGRYGLRDRFDDAETAVLRGAAKVIGAVVCMAVSLTSAGAAPTVRCGLADLSKVIRKVYVQPGGTDASGCGTTVGNACKTIQQGIKECNGTGCGVLVRYGKYELTATVELVSGVSLYGSCEFEVDAASPLTRYRSVILAPPDGKPAISATGINAATVLHGFNVLGSDAATPGAPSIAIVVKDSKGQDSGNVLLFQFNQFVGGKGAPGASGPPRGDRPPKAQDGEWGRTSWTGNSTKWCIDDRQQCDTSSASPGGRSASGNENGGTGGFMNLHWDKSFNNCLRDTGSSNGLQGGGGKNILGGYGGLGGNPGAKCASAPTNGQDGGTKSYEDLCAHSVANPSPDIAGRFNPETSTWIPSQGNKGADGGNGPGGGGGGSGGSCASYEWDSNKLVYVGEIWYAQGGGGGAGGQGGIGGAGGQQGGASFPLFLIRSPLQSDFNTFIPGPGGTGGNGSVGGLGGYGGAGGKGGVGGFDTVNGYSCPGQGGKGGDGLQGGAAAGGAGGHGGPSVAVAYVGDEKQTGGHNTFYDSQPGAGGHGGQGGSERCTAANGNDGKQPPKMRGCNYGRQPAFCFESGL